MAQLKLEIREGKQREIKARGASRVELDDTVYDEMSYANKLLVNLYETFVGDLDTVAVYTNPNGDKSYYVAQEQLEEIARKFKLV